MTQRAAHPVEHAVHSTNEWLADVAAEFDTQDTAFVYRVTRAWLHALRDRLTVIEAAHFGAQLPELLRGVYYEGWTPADMPIRISAEKFVDTFAEHADVAHVDTPKIIWAVSDVFNRRVTNLHKVLERIPADVRVLLNPR